MEGFMLRAQLGALAMASLALVLTISVRTEGSMAGVPATAPPSAGEELRKFLAAEWDYEMQRDPVRASELGDRRWNDRWPDRSLENYAADRAHRLAAIERLKTIDRGALSPADQLNYDVFKQQYERQIEENSLHWFLIPLDQREGIQTEYLLGDQLRFETARDYEDWLARLRAFPPYMDQTITLMREGMKEHILLPRIILERVQGQIGKQMVSDPASSDFYKPFRQFPEGIAEAERERLAREARAAVNDRVVPAFRRFQEFFRDEYLPACFEKVGIWQIPHGREMYAFFARKFTTTSLTPAEIHALGLREVERIRGEMQKVMDQTGFKGSRAEFFRYLRTDPQFHYNLPDELLMAYRATAKRIDPNLVKVFRTLPRMPYGVQPIADAVAPDTTAAYYRLPAADGSRAGTFMVNLYQPEARPKWEMMALALHESVPGHHLQIALATEEKDLPDFRRYTYLEVFGEGWALYAESLGEEMGLYDDPYSKFGELTYDMWRAVRLVIDTGIHEMRWTRQQAIDYFMENAPKTELDVTNEVDWYIAWPGQALAYKIGQLKIKELRARAQKELGSRFDLRDFQEVVLQNGALPLNILEQVVGRWIVVRKQQP
jgi:uncharacterized protein (DUF885 family)